MGYLRTHESTNVKVGHEADFADLENRDFWNEFIDAKVCKNLDHENNDVAIDFFLGVKSIESIEGSNGKQRKMKFLQLRKFILYIMDV